MLNKKYSIVALALKRYSHLETMASDQRNDSFTGQPESHAFAGFLFDLDGTIINTTAAVTKHWQKSVNSLSPPPLIPGRPFNLACSLFHSERKRLTA